MRAAFGERGTTAVPAGRRPTGAAAIMVDCTQATPCFSSSWGGKRMVQAAGTSGLWVGARLGGPFRETSQPVHTGLRQFRHLLTSAHNTLY